MKLKPTEITFYDLCEKGDERSLMKLYNDYAQAMFNVSLRIVKDEALAQDIMQESTIAAFSKLNQWNREATYGAWLKRIVVNNSINALRQADRLPTTSYENIAVEPVEETDLTVNESDDKAVMITLKKALAQLNDNYRTVLTLSLIEGMDNEEIGEILNISNGTCRTTISRAKSKLRVLMTEI